MNKEPVFILSDSIVRNMKKSLVPLALYKPEGRKGNILFIDGNQKFFHNPIIGYFKDATCLDVLPEEGVDFNKLPLSTKRTYIPENDFLLFYINKLKNKFFIVVDIPNILDQNRNYFRFTGEYYRKIKQIHHDLNFFSMAQVIRRVVLYFLMLVSQYGHNRLHIEIEKRLQKIKKRLPKKIPHRKPT